MTADRGRAGGRAADTEVEIKLAVTDPARIRVVLEHPAPSRLAGFAAVGTLFEHVVVDRYFDTADGRLAAAGARARIRMSADGAAVLALKRHGIEEAGVTARHEVEAPATGDLDPARWPESGARLEVLSLTGGAPLVEVAALRQRRLVRIVRRGATAVELSLDELEALDGDRVAASRWELEAELKAGDRSGLEELARSLLRLPWVAPASGSKLSFALAARGASRG